MYNRYLSTAREEPESESVSSAPEVHTAFARAPSGAGLLSGLNTALSSRLRNLHFDLDTLIIIIAVYFLIADSDDFDTDLLVLIGIMFLLGL